MLIISIIVAGDLMTFWFTPTVPIRTAWISIFLVMPLVSNLVHVQRFGEVEFWVTTFKVLGVLVLILMGIALPIRASTATPLFGTDSHANPVICSDTFYECVSRPGFDCKCYSA